MKSSEETNSDELGAEEVMVEKNIENEMKSKLKFIKSYLRSTMP